MEYIKNIICIIFIIIIIAQMIKYYPFSIEIKKYILHI